MAFGCLQWTVDFLDNGTVLHFPPAVERVLIATALSSFPVIYFLGNTHADPGEIEFQSGSNLHFPGC